MNATPLAGRRTHRPQRTPLASRSTAGLQGYRRRHAGLGAARQRRASGRRAASSITGRAASSAPAPRSRTRWCDSATARATEPNLRRRRSSSTTGSSRRKPEPLALARVRRRRAQRRLVAAHSRRLLLQDVHVAARVRGCRYEQLIRHAAGLGSAHAAPDPDRYDTATRIATCWWSARGPAGLAAALAAAHAARACCSCDEQADARRQRCSRHDDDDRRTSSAVDGRPTPSPSSRDAPDVTLLPRTTAFGYYDHNLVGLVERVTDHLAATPRAARRASACGRSAPREVVLATGAIERPLVFADNDLPGHHAGGRGAAATSTRYAVRPRLARGGLHEQRQRLRAALISLSAGSSVVAAIVDPRNPGAALAARARARRRVTDGHVVARPSGGARVDGVHGRVSTAQTRGRRRRPHIDCDLVAMSGGLNPTVHLYSQSRGKLALRRRLALTFSCPATGGQAGRTAPAP